MNNHYSGESRNAGEVVADLEKLTQEEGFMYTFCGLVLRSLWMSPDQVADIDWQERPNPQELSLLLGLMVKHQLGLELPSSAQVSDIQFTSATRLLEELHGALNFSGEFSESETVTDYEAWMSSGKGMAEPIFYSGDGAYGFQYLEMAERRYAADREWLKSHLGIELETVINITRQLQQLANDRADLITTSSSFEEMCMNCLLTFTFEPEDIVGFDEDAVRCFLKAFSLAPGAVNEELSAVGDYNAVNSHPVIQLEPERYFLPIFLNLAESVYVSPFYWMLEDSQYRETSLKNRGAATEQIAKEHLMQVFGEANVFRGVQVKRNGQDVTDIDVFATAGNKAVIVQAKSKKLTTLSKRGDDRSLRRDFKQAIQEAYAQGIISRKALLDKSTALLDESGQEIALPEEIDDAYIICLTGDHYPAITIQVDNYLQKDIGDPYPVAISIFDLEIVSFYLRDPFDFLYYMRQRSVHAEIIRSDSEMSLLGFHLKEKLFPPENSDILFADPTYAQLVDANYPVARGHWEHTEAAERLFHQWKNPTFDLIVDDVKITKQPGFTDALFLLYDLAGGAADTIVAAMEGRRRLTELDGKMHDASVPVPSQASGVTFMSFPSLTDTTADRFAGFAQARKYRARADEWLALGVIAGSSKTLDMIWYSREPWYFDPDSEKMAATFLKPGIMKYARGKKVGRNAPCPCGSGQKYKKCHCGLMSRLSSSAKV